MSRLYKLRDSACDEFLVLVGDEQDATDAQTKWETYRDTPGNIDSANSSREAVTVDLLASTLTSDFDVPAWQTLIE